ncbi:MAG: Atu4866 domain-containing protein [Rhodococcus sp. (in: high G+C Gram-positive bacteria)]
MTDEGTRRGADLRQAVADAAETASRPLLLTGGAIVTGDARIGEWSLADLLIGSGMIIGVGPGLLTAAADDDMIVIDCHGCILVPTDPDRLGSMTGSLTPGFAANIAVIRPGKHADVESPADRSALDIVFRHGRLIRWDGCDLSAEHADAPDLSPRIDHRRLGTWVDDNGFVRQELLSNGRYDEARGDRTSAYQGRYWVNGNRIDYLDDLGFWAFGEFDGDVLHHAGYQFSLMPRP